MGHCGFVWADAAELHDTLHKAHTQFCPIALLLNNTMNAKKNIRNMSINFFIFVIIIFQFQVPTHKFYPVQHGRLQPQEPIINIFSCLQLHIGNFLFELRLELN